MPDIRSQLGRLPEWAHALIFLVIGLIGVRTLDDTWVRVLFLVTLYATLGMGLNVVVGLAGLLDLGFVAFFATGAYVVAIWGAPISPSVDGVVNYWVLLPMAVLIGASVGLMLGLPVLPLRGDYLAIVTLGFGEIIRILALNMDNYTRGSSGIFEIVRPDYGFGTVDNVKAFFVMILVAAMVVWFFTSRLRDSKIGRAWEAIREDEDVAEGMGIDTTRYKLMAFGIGASVGALGGAIYAPFIDFIAPQQFGLIVSINVLGLVIIGGMGNTTGVIAGSALLIGVPELLQFQETADLLQKFGWLRDGLNTLIDGFNTVTFTHVGKLPPAEDWGEKLALYRFIVFGAMLVIVMALRPSGLFPSRRRQLEFEKEEPESGGAA
ncbi:MAG: branched-chain amino acid ABC transporter permease [Dehalococcoidia bacterium]